MKTTKRNSCKNSNWVFYLSLLWGWSSRDLNMHWLCLKEISRRKCECFQAKGIISSSSCKVCREEEDWEDRAGDTQAVGFTVSLSSWTFYFLLWQYVLLKSMYIILFSFSCSASKEVIITNNSNQIILLIIFFFLSRSPLMWFYYYFF